MVVVNLLCSFSCRLWCVFSINWRNWLLCVCLFCLFRYLKFLILDKMSFMKIHCFMLNEYYVVDKCAVSHKIILFNFFQDLARARVCHMSMSNRIVIHHMIIVYFIFILQKILMSHNLCFVITRTRCLLCDFTK